MPTTGFESSPSSTVLGEEMLGLIRRALILVGTSTTLKDDSISARRATEEARALSIAVAQMHAAATLDELSGERIRRGIQLLNRALSIADRA